MAKKLWMRESAPLVPGVVLSHPQQTARQAFLMGAATELRHHRARQQRVSQWPNVGRPNMAVLTKEVGPDRLYVAQRFRLRVFPTSDIDVRIETPDMVHTYMTASGEPGVLRIDVSHDFDNNLREVMSDPAQAAELSGRRGDPGPEGLDARFAAAGVTIGLVAVDEVLLLASYVGEADPVSYVPPGSPLPSPGA